jgi:Spy/CpxP family protein refolding chaperone
MDRSARDAFGRRDDGQVLDERQRQLFREALQKRPDELARLDAQLRDRVAELMQATLADKYDEKGVREKVEAMARIQAELMVRRCQALAVVAPSLRPDQRDALLSGRAGALLLAGGGADFGPRGAGREDFRGEPPRPPQPPPDPLRDSLFPPDLVMRFQDRIGLSADQRQGIESELQTAGPKFEQLHQQLEKERAALVALLNRERVELEAALAQLDKLLDVEREVRRAEFALQIGVKNRLTPDQQARLQELKEQPDPDPAMAAGVPPAIRGKMERVQAGVERWRRDGRNASPVEQAMREFEPLLRAGHIEEAEAVLDNALRLLESRRER